MGRGDGAFATCYFAYMENVRLFDSPRAPEIKTRRDAHYPLWEDGRGARRNVAMHPARRAAVFKQLLRGKGCGEVSSKNHTHR